MVEVLKTTVVLQKLVCQMCTKHIEKRYGPPQKRYP